MAHKWYEQSRRDDMEAIGNILIYLCKGGNLPWMCAEEIDDEHESRKVSKKIRNE